MTAAGSSGDADDEAQPSSSSDKPARAPSADERPADQPGQSRSSTPRPVALTPLTSPAVAGPSSSTTHLSPPLASLNPDLRADVKRSSSGRSLVGSFGRRSRPKSTRTTATASSQTSSQLQPPPRRYPTPLPPNDGPAATRKNHDALFSFHLPHPTATAAGPAPVVGGGLARGDFGRQMPTFQDDGAPAAPVIVEAKSRAIELALVRMTSKEGPLDAYLPQSGPNAFHSQAYLPSSMSYPLPAASLLATGGGGANAGTALPEEVVTRDDYDRIGRIGGRTGVGWMACCAGMLLFTCTDCCCCCC